jgi:hypothetical protein
MTVMRLHAPTQGEENFIDMLDHMSVINKKKHNSMTAINMIAMPNMCVTTNRRTTSSSTWIWCLITNLILMLKTKVIKNNLDVIFETTHVTTIMEEEVTNVIKTNKAIMDIIKNLHNLVKIVANTIIEHQVKQVFKCNANLMIWLAVEDFLIHHKWQ